MSSTITTAEASIQTFTVAVKVIQINNRQMTQAVFRQLPLRPCWERRSDGEWVWSGTLWGRISYFWKDCCLGHLWQARWAADTHHAHVVWERDGVLYRAGIPAYVPSEDLRPFIKEAWSAEQLFIAV